MADQPLRRLVDHLRRRAYAGGPESDCALLAAYARRHDEAAFAELVRRHAGLVLGVARRVLGDVHAAEDVGQATFLVLARRAGSIRWRESVAGWLHDVAYRLALKARAANSRPLPPPGARSPAADPAADRELRELLDAELRRLPARYRAALVLCYLEGRTRDEAAGQLGVTLAALRGHLERGRQMLRDRLLQRGYSLALGLTATALADEGSAAAPAGRWAVVAVAAAAGRAAVPEAVEQLVSAAVIGGASHCGGIAMKLLLVAAPVVLFFGFAGVGSQPGQPPVAPPVPEASTPPAARIKWEYKVVSARDLWGADAESAEKTLNKLGDEGWELVAVTTAPMSSTFSHPYGAQGGGVAAPPGRELPTVFGPNGLPVYLFKRPKP